MRKRRGIGHRGAVAMLRRAMPRDWHRIRERILARDGHVCRYCERAGTERRDADGRSWHVDHILPISRGGTTEDLNLCATCTACNTSKGTRTPDEWRTDPDYASRAQPFLCVREVAMARGWKLTQLAYAGGIQFSTMRRYWKDDVRVVNRKTLRRLCATLHVPARDLFASKQAEGEQD